MSAARILMAALLAGTTWVLLGPAANALDGGAFGNIDVLQPAGPVRELVVFFSDLDGWTPQDQAAAKAISSAGAIVVEVSTPAYLQRLDQLSETCHRPFVDAESISRQLQRENSADTYFTPILVGIGAGGTVARVAAAQALVNTIAGAVVVNGGETLPGKRPLCTDPAAAPADNGFSYVDRRPATGFIETADPSHVTPDALLALVEPHLGGAMPRSGDVASLPLIEVPASTSSDRMAIVLSGDGGWRDLDKTIADKLSDDGIPVVGWDCLRYFWRAKTPEQTAADLAAVMETYRTRWHARHIALIGYSFGADVLPFAINRLPPELRALITQISLLAFSRSADFEISVSGWLGEPPTDAALPTAPEWTRLDPKLIQCFYGEEEQDSACPELAARGIEEIRIKGGHHFDFDYLHLADVIEQGFRRRLR